MGRPALSSVYQAFFFKEIVQAGEQAPPKSIARQLRDANRGGPESPAPGRGACPVRSSYRGAPGSASRVTPQGTGRVGLAAARKHAQVPSRAPGPRSTRCSPAPQEGQAGRQAGAAQRPPCGPKRCSDSTWVWVLFVLFLYFFFSLFFSFFFPAQPEEERTSTDRLLSPTPRTTGATRSDPA